jgi:hypothetical protein
LPLDVASLAVGLVVGAVTGLLAGYLHETEAIGELQERIRIAMLRFDRIASETSSRRRKNEPDAQLHSELQALQEEIRKLYQKPNR